MTFIQQQIDFTVHATERTTEGTQYVQENAARLRNCSERLIHHWQSTGNIPITNKMARDYKISSYASARINELGKKIIILSKWVTEDGLKVKAFYLGCTCPEPKQVFTGCVLHDPSLKL